MLTENECAVRGDAILLLVAITLGGRDSDEALASSLHTCNTEVPSLDDFALTKTELEL